MLANLGWTVHPSPLSGPEQPGFTGGHIVRTYGGDGAFGFDAIQLEFGGDYRAAVNRQRVANELADAVADAAAYLKWKPLPTPPQPPRKAEEALPAVAAEYASRPEVAVYRGPGAHSREKLVQVLAESQQFRLRDITPEEIIAGKLKGAKLLIHPGGSGGGQGKSLGEAGREQVPELCEARRRICGRMHRRIWPPAITIGRCIFSTPRSWIGSIGPAGLAM